LLHLSTTANCKVDVLKADYNEKHIDYEEEGVKPTGRSKITS